MEQSMLRLAAGIAARGHSVEIGEKSQKKKNGSIRACLFRAGLETWPFIFNKNLRKLRPFQRLIQLPAFTNYFQMKRPDAVLAAEPRYNLIATLARRSARVNTRIVISERVQPTQRAVDQGPWAHPHVHDLLRYGYLSADAIVAVSNGVADDLAAFAKIPRQRIVTVYNPVIGPDILALAEEPLDHPWFAPDAPPVILAAGRIDPQKDYLTLIRAFSRVRAERTKAMCGITGFITMDQTRAADWLRQTVVTMADALQHRGPDDNGVWVDAEAGLALGHRRLSIIDLSPLGHQPMVSADGRFVLTYNGEVYNYQPIRADLEALDYPFKGHSDTEVLLAGIVCWGLVETLRRANGMFALAVWDRQEHTLTLARDRTGKKPLYYGWCNGTFLFASELKALRKHPAFIADIDRDALGLYVRYSWMPAPYTIFRGIRHLPAASILRVTPNGPHGQHPGAQKIRWSGLSQHPACMLG